MIIYDYANRTIDIKLPDKKILFIFVNILSGDETGRVVFKDGDMVYFDAANCRTKDFDEGAYYVYEQDIPKWLDFKPHEGKTASYERYTLFYNGGDNNDQ